mgnify:CR=1 FL=1
MIEFSAGNAEINSRADRYFATLRRGFRAGLEKSMADGTLPADFPIAEMVEVLLSSALGLNAVIRASGDHLAGEKMAASIAALIKGWAVR